jgi:membrane-associated protease RseP (regulator of RpoE activity)
VALLSITTTHEFGHYFISKKRNVEASLPFFIPGPPPIGTFGAVIFQRSPVTNRDKLFDIGLMGPITGFIIALLVAIISIKLSPIIYYNVLYDIYQFEYQINLLINDFIINVYNNYPPAIALTVAQSLSASGYWPFQIIGQSPFSEPLLFSILVPLLRPEIELGSFFVNPLYWAAWVGFLITALNLFPIGMLDGGHMFRAILEKRTHYFASIIVAVILIAISYIYIIMALVALFSIRKGGHPGALDDVSPLTTSRKILFIVMMFILIITIPPLGWRLLI